MVSGKDRRVTCGLCICRCLPNGSIRDTIGCQLCTPIDGELRYVAALYKKLQDTDQSTLRNGLLAY